MKVTKDTYIKLRKQHSNPINLCHALNNHYGKLKLSISDFEKTIAMYLMITQKTTLLKGCASIQKLFDEKFAHK